MKVLCSPQAFKGTLSALAAAEAMAVGVRRALPDAEVIVSPMADGGDDTLDVLIAATGGRYFSTTVQDPLGRSVSAQWGLLGDGETAVVEMARASGIRLLTQSELAPLNTSTYGTGQLITAALNAGYQKLLVCVGGSATVDCGMGAVSALGVRFFDTSGQTLKPVGASLAKAARIDVSGLDKRLDTINMEVVCDVTMPLNGPRGAWNFAAQKGATPEAIKELRSGLEHFTRVVSKELGVHLDDFPQAGPAGGLAGGLLAFCKARLLHGSLLILERTDLDRLIPTVDLVLTGEGYFDETTFNGKGPSEVIGLAQRSGVPTIVIAGDIAPTLGDLSSKGVVGAETLKSHAASLDAAKAAPADIITLATITALTKRYHRGAL